MTYCTSRKLSGKLVFSIDVNKEKAPHDTLKERISSVIIPLSANPTKWSNTLKQFLGKLPTNCLSVFDHFVRLALKGLPRLVNDSNIDFIVFPRPMNIVPLNNMQSKKSK